MRIYRAGCVALERAWLYTCAGMLRCMGRGRRENQKQAKHKSIQSESSMHMTCVQKKLHTQEGGAMGMGWKFQNTVQGNDGVAVGWRHGCCRPGAVLSLVFKTSRVVDGGRKMPGKGRGWSGKIL